MAKISLTAAPTFKAPVDIPVAGGEPLVAVFTFKHRTRTALDEFIAERPKKSDIDAFMEMVEGWDIDVPFNKENAEILLENYIGTSLATYRVYLEELIQAKAKN